MKEVATHLIVASLVAAFAWSPGPAQAESDLRTGVSVELTPVQTAQFIFDTAVYLMGERKFTLACMLFEKSDRIDPAMGTKFYLADCYEQTGRFVLAWSTFRAVIDAAKREKRPDREDLARRRALALIPRMGKIAITLAPSFWDTASLSLTVDEVPLVKEKQAEGSELLQVVDPGEHVITVSGGGRTWWREKVRAESGKRIRIVIPDLTPAHTPLKDAPPVGIAPVTTGRSYLLLDPKNPYQ